MAMVENGLIKKLKLGLAGLSIIGASYFNSFNANAQEAQKEIIQAQTTTTQDPRILENLKAWEEIRNYIPKYNTIVHEMLNIENSEEEDSLYMKKFPLWRLEKIIDSTKTFIIKKDYTKKELEVLSKKIYSTINKIDVDLYSNLQQGNLPFFDEITDFCYRYSLYYLAIGEANKIPFHMIEIPKDNGNTLGHVFIRYGLDGRHCSLNPNSQFNKGDVNIEATTGEIEDKNKWTDEYYIDEYLIPYEAIDKNSLRSLNEKDLLALAYCQKIKKEVNYNNEHEKKYELYKKALEDCDKVLKLKPNDFATHYYKGEIYKILDKLAKDDKESFSYFTKSIENFIKAAEIIPDPNLYSKIAYSYYWKDGKEYCYKDIEYIEKAINLTKEYLKNEKNPERLKKLEENIKRFTDYKETIEKNTRYKYGWCEKINKNSTTNIRQE